MNPFYFVLNILSMTHWQIRDELRTKIATLCSDMEVKKKSVLEKTNQLSRMAKALEMVRMGLFLLYMLEKD